MSRNRALALLVAIATVACTTKDTTSTTTIPANPTTTFNGTYTLQGFVADATTGARIGGTDLQLFLIQGAAVRAPTRLNSGAADPLLGEFAFDGIPADYNLGNKIYKLKVVKPGYQPFEAEVTFKATSSAVLDTVFNVIGNVYLFPLGAAAPDLRFVVTYDGMPVPNATVLLDPSTTASDPLHNTLRALTTPSGSLASLAATTDPSGVASFSGANLVLGGAYAAQVLPVTFNGAGGPVPLARFESATNYVVGVNDVEHRIALSDLAYARLYVLSASNQPVGQVNPAGTLAITFSGPVTLRNDTGFTATFTNGAGATPVAATVAAALSADARTLTLTPDFATTVATHGATVDYADGTAFVEAVGYPALAQRVFADLKLANGAAVSPVVVVTAP